MKIELILDTNCLSAMTYIEMMNKLAEEFSGDEMILTLFENDSQRMKELGIRVLPAWLIDNQLVRIHPGNYEMIRAQIRMRSERQNGGRDN